MTPDEIKATEPEIEPDDADNPTESVLGETIYDEDES